MHDTLTSRDNPIFKRLKKLAESARARREACMALLDGEHLVSAYLDAGGLPHTLLYAASCAGEVWQPLAARCGNVDTAERCGGIKVAAVADALFAELSPVQSPTGVLAEAAWLNPSVPEGVPLVLVLEDIQDPGNLGAMLRTGAAAGATLAVLSRGCHDAWSPKALRGGQGAQFVLPVLMGVNLTDWLAGFNGRRIALALNRDESLYAQDMADPVAIVVGNEGAGISAEVLAAVDVVTQIPMPGKIESLNAAAALAVAMFEAVRQRGK